MSEECMKCDLHQWRKEIVHGDGPVPCDVMLIGEAPGRDEDILGKPFVGAAGKILKIALEKAGYERKDVYITNIVKCRPPGNRVPKPEEISACAVYLDDEIERVSPSRIILLGRTASRTFRKYFPKFTIARDVYHPAYALHAPDMRDVVIEQIVSALNE